MADRKEPGTFAQRVRPDAEKPPNAEVIIKAYDETLAALSEPQRAAVEAYVILRAQQMLRPGVDLGELSQRMGNTDFGPGYFGVAD